MHAAIIAFLPSPSVPASAASPAAPDLAGARAVAASRGWTVDEDHVFVLRATESPADATSLAPLRVAAADGRIGAVVVHGLHPDALPVSVRMTIVGPLNDAGVVVWSSVTGARVGRDERVDRFLGAAYGFARELLREDAAYRGLAPVGV